MGASWVLSAAVLNLFEQWLFFAALMAVGQFSPGPDMVLLTRTSLKWGRRAGWLMVLGIVTGLCLHAAIAIGGMSALLARGGWWEMVLTVGAAAYLGWLGWQMVRGGPPQEEGLAVVASESGVKNRWYLQGLLCNVLNPKVVIFFAGMTTLFLRESQPDWWPLLLWATIVGEGLLLWGLWVVVLQNRAVRRGYQRIGRQLDLLFGVLLWVLAALLLGRLF